MLNVELTNKWALFSGVLPSQSSHGSGAASVPSPGTSSAAQSWPGDMSATSIMCRRRSLNQTEDQLERRWKNYLFKNKDWAVVSLVFYTFTAML